MKRELVAKTLVGFETVLADELQALGAGDVKIQNRAVTFTGDMEMIYKANLWLRTAIRILMPIHSFKAVNEEELYKGVLAFDFSPYFNPNMTFAIDSTVHSEFFNHSKYVALKTKDAVADQFRNKYGRRPNVDVQNPNVQLHIHVDQDSCTLSLDTSGDSLHLRNYRQHVKEAPLSEVMAAGMLLLAGWKGQCNLIDGFCGSGTILIEAAMIARNIPAGIYRTNFAFMGWKDYDSALWRRLKREAMAEKRGFLYQIIGSDLDPSAVKVAEMNIDIARLHDTITLREGDFKDLDPPTGGGMVVINPPYGERIGENVDELYKLIGDTLKKKYTGFEAWVLSSNKGAMNQIGLKTSRRFALRNGSLDCKYFGYSLYEGSKKLTKEGKENNDE